MKSLQKRVLAIIAILSFVTFTYAQQIGDGLGIRITDLDAQSIESNLPTGQYSVNNGLNFPINNSSWHYLFTMKHTYPTSTQYSFQLTAPYFTEGAFFFRTLTAGNVANGATTAKWYRVATTSSNTFEGSQYFPNGIWDDNGRIALGTTSTAYGKIKIYGEGIDNGFTLHNTGFATFRMYLKNNIGFITRGGNDESGIAINNYGYVGIGKVNPTAKLDVNGTVKASQLIAPKAIIDEIQLLGNKSIGLIASGQYNYTETHNGVSENQEVEHYSLGWYGFNHNMGPTAILSSWYEVQFHTQGKRRMAIKNGGNVVVYEKLIAPDIEVMPRSELPDYVFDDDYNLRSLEEVEDFIDENNHLPEVPSAKEVAENGMSMNDMTFTLLKKVEELTLYVIEQNKKIEQLEKQNIELQKQIK